MTNQQILLANFQGMYSSWRGEFDLNLGRKCMKSMGALTTHLWVFLDRLSDTCMQQVLFFKQTQERPTVIKKLEM